MVHRVRAAAGDAILFTEALEHGTLPWTSAGRTRTTLFCKFTPCCEAYSGEASWFDPVHYAPGGARQLGARAAAILSPPPASFLQTACARHRRRQSEGAGVGELEWLQRAVAAESASGVHPPAARAPHASM